MTLLTSEPKQFVLKDDGLIYWQVDATNPMPGEPVARLVRGETYLSPKIECLSPEHGADVVEKLSTWLHLHLVKVLEPLIKLVDGVDALPAPVSAICKALHDALGILPREKLAEYIETLDADMRKTLRARHVKLGPILVFVPDLNRPAAVRLRGLLWSLYHDKPLPAPVPKDGAVSVVVDVAAADPAFYQSIGYPLYANRVIRIDMLDRVISAVYDSVKDNQFQAKHEMAEWLGSSIPDLYAVLEAMGHRKVHDPADDKPAVADVSALVAVIPAQTDTPAVPELNVSEIAAPAAADAPVEPAKPAPIVKPALATFKVWWPRKIKPTTPVAMNTRPERLSPEEMAERAERFKKPERDQRPDRADRADKPKHFERKKKPTKVEKNLRVIKSSAPKAKPEDSPFAILGSLKFKND